VHRYPEARDDTMPRLADRSAGTSRRHPTSKL
jgi:hypothetical protein